MLSFAGFATAVAHPVDPHLVSFAVGNEHIVIGCGAHGARIGDAGSDHLNREALGHLGFGAIRHFGLLDEIRRGFGDERLGQVARSDEAPHAGRIGFPITEHCLAGKDRLCRISGRRDQSCSRQGCEQNKGTHFTLLSEPSPTTPQRRQPLNVPN
jgi:hypothetical protein